MGLFHMDDSCEAAIIKLNDELCEWERATSRQVTMIIIPHNADESILVSQNGKPLEPGLAEKIGLHGMLESTLRERGK